MEWHCDKKRRIYGPNPEYFPMADVKNSDVSKKIWPILYKHLAADRLGRLSGMLNLRLVSRSWYQLIDSSEEWFDHLLNFGDRKLYWRCEKIIASLVKIGPLPQKYLGYYS
jgi:hypothetical protein